MFNRYFENNYINPTDEVEVVQTAQADFSIDTGTESHEVYSVYSCTGNCCS